MAKGEKINRLLNLGAAHALFFKDSTWYHELTAFPGILIDPSGFSRFETRVEYLNYPGLEFGPAPNQVHIRPYGISSLPNYQLFSETQQLRLQEAGLATPAHPVAALTEPDPTTEETLKQKREVNLYLRNRGLVNELKTLYKNTCQICGTRLKIRSKGPKYYSEIHHIKGLGFPHHGPDSRDNMLCVCPDHHTRLDFFTFSLNPADFVLNKHAINPTYIAYHNQQVERYNAYLKRPQHLLGPF